MLKYNNLNNEIKSLPTNVKDDVSTTKSITK